jgi:drug/metabolite transporter (DMT)-like permease
MIVALINYFTKVDTIKAIDFLIFVVVIIGAALICKPAFIFSNENRENPIGYIIIFIAGLLFAFSIYCNALINKYFNTYTTCLGIGITFLIQYAFILMFFNKSSFKDFELNNFFWNSIQGSLYFFNLIFFIKSIGKKASKTIMLFGFCGVLFSFPFDYLIFNKRLDFLDIFGAFLVIVVNSYKIYFEKH